MPIKALQRDRQAPADSRVYHPYVNDPSFCQRLFEIACLILILASVPAFLGGVYSIFVTGYGTALGLLGLLTFGTRRHTCMFLVMSLLFFAFLIVVIILNAIDPIGKNIPFYDQTNYSELNNNNGTTNGTDSNGNQDNNNSKRAFFSRQNTACSYNNCSFNLFAVGELSDGQLRLNYGSGASAVSFSLNNGQLVDNAGRKCYLSAQSQLQCDFIPQTNDYQSFCIQNGQLTHSASSQWYFCYTGTGPTAANIYSGKLYGHCSPFMNLTVVNSTCGAGSEGTPDDAAIRNFLASGFDINNGTNTTVNNGTAANNGTNTDNATGAFVGSRVYAYIDSGILLAATLLSIIAALAILKELRPAPGTLTHSTTTSTTSAPTAAGGYGGSQGMNSGLGGVNSGLGGANSGMGAAPGYAGSGVNGSAIPAAGSTGLAGTTGASTLGHRY